jgi:CO dehydrogenase/acetyl-CoA synthase epsilon subunit
MEKYKTLATCSNMEFIRQCGKVAAILAPMISQFQKVASANKLKLTGEETVEEATKLKQENNMRVATSLIQTILVENAEKAIELCGVMCFLTDDEIEQAKQGTDRTVIFEAIGSLSDPNVSDFFTAVLQSLSPCTTKQ